MYLMYVDESGDVGQISDGSPTRFFVLSAIVFHENSWNPLLQDLLSFRRNLSVNKKLKLREEIHASAFINKPGELVRIKKNDRLDILKKSIDWIAAHSEISVISVVVDKTKNRGKEIFELAWEKLIQRFENTLQNGNFPNSIPGHQQRGMILPDNTDNKKLKELIRKMRQFSPTQNTQPQTGRGQRNLALTYIIEDPFMKESAESYFHQMVDVVAYFARQKVEPNAYILKKSAFNFYDRLIPVINKKAAAGSPLHLVRA